MRFHALAGRYAAWPIIPLAKESLMKRVIVLMMMALFSMSFITACNTVKGAGQDVQKVGDKVEQAADNTGATDPR